DEVHLGRFTLLLATDPIRDLPVAFALVGANDHDHMRRFLQDLKNCGLRPRTIITDGSNLYPALLAELWPGDRLQGLVDRGRDQLNPDGPLQDPADAIDAGVDRRAAEAGADQLLPDRPQRQRAEVGRRGRAVELAERADGGAEVLELLGRPAVGP